jgi:hypothetical protein
MDFLNLREGVRIGSILLPLISLLNPLTEPVFVNVYGAQESIRGIDSASLCSLAGGYDK